MEFKSRSSIKRGPIRLQFYRNPPIDEVIELSELESLAIDRLRVLKCVEVVRQDFVFGTKDYEARLTSELSKLGSFGKLLTQTTTGCGQTKAGGMSAVEDDIKRDIISHFVLQIAYCRSDDQRRWFIQQEVDLFRYRFLRERCTTADVIADFLVESDLHFSLTSDAERFQLQSQLTAGTAGSESSTTFYKVYFIEVPDLVRHRRVFLHKGYAYVPESNLVSLVVSHFRTSLSFSLSRLGLTLTSRLACEENRVLPLLSSLSMRYLGDNQYTGHQTTSSDSTTIAKADQIDGLAKQPGRFPPCMAQLHQALSNQRHLRHHGRMQFGLFLKGIGLPLDESLKFWRNAFAPKYDSEQFAKNYAYNIRHNYGKEGKRADYTPYSCARILTSTGPGPGEFHGCPFKHMDPDLLKQRLASGGHLTSDCVDSITGHAKNRMYHLACREYFRGMHQLSVDAMASINSIHHPNQYFDESTRVLADGDANKPVARVTKVKLEQQQSIDASDLTTSQIDDTIVIDMADSDDAVVCEASLVDESLPVET